MKTRLGFVSNSSSSSFVINVKDLTHAQKHCLKNLSNIGDEDFDENPWSIYEEKGCLYGNTWMDNFDMRKFFEKIEIPEDKVLWGD